MLLSGRQRRSAWIAFSLALGLASSTAEAARDRTPPSTPTDFRVIRVTSYTASLAWNASSDKSGIASYVICCAHTNSQTVPGSATTVTYTAGLEAGRTFTLRIYAVDGAGNYSKASNSVTFTLPRDTIPPTKPVVSVTDVGPTHVSLAWASTEDGPNLWFTVFKNGTAVIQGSKSSSAIIPLLEPETAYAFTVQARDFGGNASPVSDPVTPTTEAPNPDDVTPPTTPGNFHENNWGDCEVELDWDESTDDLDPLFSIEYEIFVNGVYDHSLALRFTRTIVYGTQNGLNEFSVVAVDTAGNRSAPATITANLNCFP
jgi:hypothetical protein